MIYECLIVPSESPSSLLEIKKALLTYDKVKLVDPSDRDLLPSNSYQSIISGSPVFGFDMGAVRPMGKILGYDEKFERIVDECRPAINQGLIDVISTYNISETKNLSVGGVPMGGYPLDPSVVFQIYRSMVGEESFLRNAISYEKHNLIESLEFNDKLALSGIGDNRINDSSALPILNDGSIPKDKRVLITNIARARLAATIKYAGFCESKEVVPVFHHDVYGKIISNIINNTRSVFSEDRDDRFWLKKSRVLQLCHEEFMDDSKLETLSIEQIIRLRSKAWGVQAASRDELFASVSEVALEASNRPSFQQEAKKLIGKYRDESETLVRERANIGHMIKCDLGSSALALGGGALVANESQLISPASITTTLIAGGIWFLQRRKEYLPQLENLKSQEEKLRRGAGFGLYNFYSRIK